MTQTTARPAQLAGLLALKQNNLGQAETLLSRLVQVAPNAV